jgi:hypothetical protein
VGALSAASALSDFVGSFTSAFAAVQDDRVLRPCRSA